MKQPFINSRDYLMTSISRDRTTNTAAANTLKTIKNVCSIFKSFFSYIDIAIDI